MKRLIKTVAILLLCGVLAVPVVDARGRNNSGNGSQQTHQPASRPSQGGSRATQSHTSSQSRPSSQSNRPSNSGNNHSRPGGNNARPGNQSGQNMHNRPGNHNNYGNSHNDRPNNNQGYRPGGPGYNGPGHGHYSAPVTNHHNYGHHHHGPMRPHMRPHRPFYRPTPPPTWHPVQSWRPFHSILGITLGTAFNMSLNALLNNGYVINSYGDNMIYVGEVPMLNMMWPDAILFYNTGGALCGSRFVYSTPGYSMNRYNMAYTSLMNTYGAPVSIQNVANGVEATWWGTYNQFIRLSYMADYANDGSLRYFTTLSFGNY